MADLRRREADAAAHVRPQREFADLVVRFHRQRADHPWVGLGAWIAFRPTLPYPELRDLVVSLPQNDHRPVRFLLGRDAAWPDPVVEIDGDCPPALGALIEEAVWRSLVPGHGLDRDRIGRFALPGGRERRGEALALAQLLIVYHLACALRGVLEV